MTKKYKTLKAKIDLLHKKALFLSKTNEYNDYYDDYRDWRAGENKVRPAAIIREFPRKYFLVSFATSAYHKAKSGRRKGSVHIKFKDVNYYFNPTSAYIFNREILENNISKYIGLINDDCQFRNLINEVLDKGQTWNKSDPNLISKITDALLIEDYKTADELIKKQFHEITVEDIEKRQEIINKRSQFMRAVNKKNHK